MGEAVRETVDRCERLIASRCCCWPAPRRPPAARSRSTSPRSPATASPICARGPIEAGVEVTAQLEPAWVDGIPG